MADLSAAATNAWLDKLPEPFRSDTPQATPEADGSIAAIVASIDPSDPGKVLEVVAAHDDEFVQMGRARRLRFLAWLVNQPYPNRRMLSARLTGDGDVESDDGGGHQGGVNEGKSAPLFLADVKAIINSLGENFTKGLIGNIRLKQIQQASLRMQAETAPKREGGMP